MASNPITSWQIDGETMETVTDFIFLGSKITVNSDCSHKIKRHLLLGRKAMTNLDSVFKSRDITLLTKVHLVKAMVFSSSHVWMWELDHKKVECWRIDAFELWCWRGLLRVPWSARQSNQSIVKEIGPEGRADAEAPILWPSDVKSWLIGKDPNAGEDWRQEEKGTTEDEMVGWHHWLNGHDFGQTLGDYEGQGSLTCCSPWCCKELDMTEWLNSSNFPLTHFLN